MAVHYQETSLYEAVRLAAGKDHLARSLRAVRSQIDGPSACRECPCSKGIMIAEAYSNGAQNPTNFAAVTKCGSGGAALVPLRRGERRGCPRLVFQPDHVAGEDFLPGESRR